MIAWWGAAGAYATTATPTDTIAPLTAVKCFTEAPKDVVKHISPTTRLDMVDYYQAGMDHPSANAIGGECLITAMEPQKITVEGGTGIKYEMFVLDASSKQYIGMIETVETPIPDSMVKFYTSDWKELTGKKHALWTEPTLADWLPGADKKQLQQAREALPFVLATCSYDPQQSTLTVTNNMEQYYSKLDTPEILSQMQKQLVYRWDAKRKAFILDKR